MTQSIGGGFQQRETTANPPQQPRAAEFPPGFKGREDYPDEGCPECGVILDENVNREKHAIFHYGEIPLPVNHLTLVARQRQAFLRGDELPRR